MGIHIHGYSYAFQVMLQLVEFLRIVFILFNSYYWFYQLELATSLRKRRCSSVVSKELLSRAKLWTMCARSRKGEVRDRGLRERSNEDIGGRTRRAISWRRLEGQEECPSVRECCSREGAPSPATALQLPLQRLPENIVIEGTKEFTGCQKLLPAIFDNFTAVGR